MMCFRNRDRKCISILLAVIIMGSITVNGVAAEADYSFIDDYSKEQLVELDKAVHRKLNTIAGNMITEEQPITVEKCSIRQDGDNNYLDVKIRNNSDVDIVEGVQVSFQVLDEQGDALESNSLWYERVDAGQGVTSSLWIDGNIGVAIEDIAAFKFFEVYNFDTRASTSFEVPYVFDGSGTDELDLTDAGESGTADADTDNEADAGTDDEAVAETDEAAGGDDVADVAVEELEPNFVFHTEAVSAAEGEAKYETLTVGSSGDAVVRMQEELIAQEFLTGDADGKFGNGTKAAVASFQESVGLAGTGEADSRTLEILYGEYEEPEIDVAAALQEQTWLFNGGENTILNGISFTGDAATVAQVYFDGNGKHDNESNAFHYEITDECIKLSMLDGSEMEVPYEVKNGQLSLSNGEWKSVEEVKAGLQGNWTQRFVDMGVTFEYHAAIDGDMFYSEDANSNGFYFGPYEGSYTLNFGGFDADFMHAYNWFYNIIDGEVTLLRYDRELSRTDAGLPGQYGYSF